MITETYELPTHWACALNYGEMDGLEDEDISNRSFYRGYGKALWWLLVLRSIF